MALYITLCDVLTALRLNLASISLEFFPGQYKHIGAGAAAYLEHHRASRSRFQRKRYRCSCSG